LKPINQKKSKIVRKVTLLKAPNFDSRKMDLIKTVFVRIKM
jgi:hypothetical protein